MANESRENHGEGNPEAAAEFNAAEQKFVNSQGGKQKIAEGPKVKPGEEASLESAEAAARKHAKYDDSSTKAMDSKKK